MTSSDFMKNRFDQNINIGDTVVTVRSIPGYPPRIFYGKITKIKPDNDYWKAKVTVELDDIPGNSLNDMRLTSTYRTHIYNVYKVEPLRSGNAGHVGHERLTPELTRGGSEVSEK